MKIRRLILALLVVLIFAGKPLSADCFSYGIKGGVDYAEFGGYSSRFWSIDESAQQIYDCKSKIGFSAGLFVSISLVDMIAIQPAILFSLKGTRVELEGFEGFEYDDLYYVEIPLLLKFYPPIRLSIVRLNTFAGPCLGIDVLNRYRTTYEVKEFYQLLGVGTEGEYENVKRLDYGIVFGLGADIGRIVIEIGYSLGLTTIDDSPFAYDLRNITLTIMAGYRLM